MSTQKAMAVGETLAKNYLILNGYEIIGENIRYKGSELDLVAIDPLDGYYVFVEVKYRSEKGGFHPLDAVTPHKIACLKKGATLYLLEKNLYEIADVRFDVISVIANEIDEHIKNAF